MKTHLIMAALTSLVGARLAAAQEPVATTSDGPVPDGTIGLGAELQLSGLGGPSLNYDAGAFHVGGFLAFDDDGGPDNTDFGVGARFFFHLHASSMSDFSVGGNLGLYSDQTPAPDPMDPPTRDTDMYLEPAAQIRMFVARNVALSATLGIVIGFADADGVSFEGQITAGAGVHYYFFK